MTHFLERRKDKIKENRWTKEMASLKRNMTSEQMTLQQMTLTSWIWSRRRNSISKIKMKQEGHFQFRFNYFVKIFQHFFALKKFRQSTDFFNNGPSSASFSVIFKQTLQIYSILMWKNVHPESGAGIQTHNLLIMSKKYLFIPLRQKIVKS